MRTYRRIKTVVTADPDRPQKLHPPEIVEQLYQQTLARHGVKFDQLRQRPPQYLIQALAEAQLLDGPRTLPWAVTAATVLLVIEQTSEFSIVTGLAYGPPRKNHKLLRQVVEFLRQGPVVWEARLTARRLLGKE